MWWGEDASTVFDQPGLGYWGNPDSRPECRAGAPLQPIRYDELVTLDYPPGPAAEEPLRITVKACPPVGSVTRSFTVSLPAKDGVVPDSSTP